MEPIPPINTAASRPPAGLGSSLGPSGSGSAEATASLAQLNGATGTSSTTAITQIHQAVTQMLQSVGGGVEDDKVLKMLIGLLILLALLQEWYGATESPQDALARLGEGTGQSGAASLYFSSTTITLEQTTTTVVLQTQGAYGNAGGEQEASKGGQVDVAA